MATRSPLEWGHLPVFIRDRLNRVFEAETVRIRQTINIEFTLERNDAFFLVIAVQQRIEPKGVPSGWWNGAGWIEPERDVGHEGKCMDESVAAEGQVGHLHFHAWWPISVRDV